MTASMVDNGHAEPAFNLLVEPWLPVIRLDGSRGAVGLCVLFDRSREIRGLAESSPTSFIALHRLLLALTHRALTLHMGRWGDGDRARWYRDGLPADAFERYFAKWADRFWLFHPTHPFMQVAALAQSPQTALAKPWTQVALTRAAGNNPVVFDHSVDTEPQPQPAGRVLRELIGYLQTVPGGPVKVLHGHDKKGPLFDSAAALPLGTSLCQTLCLGLHPADVNPELADKPAWESEPPGLARLLAAPTLPSGHNDRYSRLTRAGLLMPEDGGATVRGLRFAEGLALLDDPMDSDPMLSYKQVDEKALRLRFSEGRAVWRDLPALLPTMQDAPWRPAAILGWARNLLIALDDEAGALQVVVAGMAANQGKVLQQRMEQFRLPQPLLANPDLAAELRMAIHQAESLHASLKSLAAAMTAAAAPDAASKDARSRARAAVEAGPSSATFFAHVEQGVAALLDTLAAANVLAARAHWSATLLEAARAAWTAACAALGDSPAALRARALHEGRFGTLLRKERLRFVPPQVETEESTP
jgi:CRISPR system Cascade subunit CasA